MEESTQVKHTFNRDMSLMRVKNGRLLSEGLLMEGGGGPYVRFRLLEMLMLPC